MPMTDSLDTEIWSLYAELVDAVPPPPTLDLEEMKVTARSKGGGWTFRRRPSHGKGPHVGVLIGVAALAIAAVLIVVSVIPSAHQPTVGHPKVAAATQLHKIALAVEQQPEASPGPNQWLRTEQRMSIAAEVSQIGTTPTPNVQATIDATITTWSNTTGQACISAATQPAQFASPTNQAAWTAAGLTDQPSNQPVTGCDSIIQGDSVGTLTQSTGVIDVSGLPTDPTALARELETGTTGIPAIDSVPSDQGTSTAFERATILLIGPDSGTSSAFESALYGAIASTPGIQSLGPIKTHSGSIGVGFSGPTSVGGTTIVVNPSNGSLLEARNVRDNVGFDVLSTHYLAPQTSPGPGQSIGTEGGSYGAAVQWLDPVATPTVIGPDAELSSGDVAIFTIANLGVTFNQVDSLRQALWHELSGLSSSGGSASSAVLYNPHVPPATTANGQIINIGATNYFNFDGSQQTIQQWLTALKASGLFATILAY